MIYIVSGLFRSGTAMMVKAIDFGGIPAAYSEERNRDISDYIKPNYHPNIHGWMELDKESPDQADFPNMYDGKVIKVLFHSLDKIAYCPTGIRIIFMGRDIEEIALSMMELRKVSVAPDLQKRFDSQIDKFSKRDDIVSVHKFWYSNVLKNPLRYFRALARDGWPINPERAATIPDPEHRHINLKKR